MIVFHAERWYKCLMNVLSKRSTKRNVRHQYKTLIRDSNCNVGKEFNISRESTAMLEKNSKLIRESTAMLEEFNINMRKHCNVGRV